jgi:hypothetical protein
MGCSASQVDPVVASDEDGGFEKNFSYYILIFAF